ncbi:hypothetical protein GLA29479_3146 [Lysobacter antibioticus]|nr:hypothetical protein GLA29479_3146 [Lysobacter antibioticus]
MARWCSNRTHIPDWPSRQAPKWPFGYRSPRITHPPAPPCGRDWRRLPSAIKGLRVRTNGQAAWTESSGRRSRT